MRCKIIVQLHSSKWEILPAPKISIFTFCRNTNIDHWCRLENMLLSILSNGIAVHIDNYWAHADTRLNRQKICEKIANGPNKNSLHATRSTFEILYLIWAQKLISGISENICNYLTRGKDPLSVVIFIKLSLCFGVHTIRLRHIRMVFLRRKSTFETLYSKS